MLGNSLFRAAKVDSLAPGNTRVNDLSALQWKLLTVTTALHSAGNWLKLHFRLNLPCWHLCHCSKFLSHRLTTPALIEDKYLTLQSVRMMMMALTKQGLKIEPTFLCFFLQVIQVVGAWWPLVAFIHLAQISDAGPLLIASQTSSHYNALVKTHDV